MNTDKGYHIHLRKIGIYSLIAIRLYGLIMIRAKIDERLERKFRELAMKKFGYGKGSLTRAVEEAILRWIATAEREIIEFEGDPVMAIDGLLLDIDVDSVELQHKIRDLWAWRPSEDVPS